MNRKNKLSYLFKEIKLIILFYIIIMGKIFHVKSKTKYIWKGIYNNLTFFVEDWTLFNWGYTDDTIHQSVKLVEDDDKKEKYSIQLYHYVATANGKINLAGKKILEVSCGRGGGCSYICRYLKPREMVGIDLSNKQIEICKKMYKNIKNLSFFQGDAENINYHDQTFDIVLNVESSIFYPHFEKFAYEVKRVLKKNGLFLYTDVMRKGKLNERREIFSKLGLKILEEEDISSGVLKVSSLDNERKMSYINQYPFFKNFFKLLFCIVDTPLNKKIKEGSLRYMRFMIQKS